MWAVRRWQNLDSRREWMSSGTERECHRMTTAEASRDGAEGRTRWGDVGGAEKQIPKTTEIQEQRRIRRTGTGRNEDNGIQRDWQQTEEYNYK
ncbi:hypothetical protein KFL_012720020 [Klebsormidium nitens]|uniref:Uncharacterized protein n=1 Tax=Klebsormidium nitens TaxID=105231 RepID=A0A1Y1IUK9_KLENI|nr:hypothetical protein KFL_012720020 [Klebsormidium nitens]|eukprot:GAQ93051.1 hypothetical protein KFL_012720020 [Klebsormidium nitens]